MNIDIQAISNTFQKFSGSLPEELIALPPSGSYRKYYRLKLQGESFIGVYNEDFKENKAFISYTNHFFKLNLNVPKVLAEDLINSTYILQDLGDISLLAYISDKNGNTALSPEGFEMYKKVLSQLPLFQVKGGKNIDYAVAYPRAAFDKQSMLWDLNYFKYYFLKLAKIPFDEQLLENDFLAFSDFLLKADCNHFLYRDFQSRNVMIQNNTPYYIDYQGGRKGALQYDVASILFEAKTSLSAETRGILLDHYLEELAMQIEFDRTDFLNYYYGYVYIRLMQAMGAYGFRGLYEKKELFLQSIPKAIEHLKWLRQNVKLPISFPELDKVWDRLIVSDFAKTYTATVQGLTLIINSFSYKKGIPVDYSPNGGGFVFDCRALENPGRLEQYQKLTGLDKPVQEFLETHSTVEKFLENVNALVDNSIENYLSRKFNNLMVSFGCTGGQHRSVYSAENLAKHVKSKFQDVKVVLVHRELEKK